MFPSAARTGVADAAASPRWKTVIASGLAIYPPILVIPPLLKPLTVHLPVWLEGLTTVVVLTPLATFVTLPAVTRILQLWLYRGPPKA